MKRKYEKPYLAVESFQLDAAIAGACLDEQKAPLNLQINTCNREDENFQDTFFGYACQDDVYNNPDICYQAFMLNSAYLTS